MKLYSKYLTRSLLSGLLLSGSSIAFAQGAGSTATYTGLGLAGGDFSTVEETVYIGPGAYVINGAWHIYSKNAWISPDATFSGTGNIHFYNPSVAGGAASTTIIDGNNSLNSINLAITLNNASGMTIEEIVKDASLSAWADNTGSSTVYVGTDLDLTVDGANVILGNTVNGDLKFTSAATFNNYGPARMVVTNNSILSHVVKEDLSGGFVFPVGIAAGDYTPARVDNAAANTTYVSVQDYVNSASEEAIDGSGSPGVEEADGIDRTWHIYAANAGIAADLTLQHNLSTNQPWFDDASHFITQWSASGVVNPTGDNFIDYDYSGWQSNTPMAGTTGTLFVSGSGAGTSMMTRTYASLATDPLEGESYFSKSSDVIHPLPITLIDFSADVKECMAYINWETANELNVKAYNVEKSKDGLHYEKVGTVAATNKADGNKYHFVTRMTEAVAYYRLAVIDDAQKAHMSKTIRVVNKGCNQQTVSVYPNPTDAILYIEGLVENNTVFVYNTLGQVVLYKNVSSNGKVSVDLTNLPASNYQLKVYSAERAPVFSTKVVKF